MQLLSRSRVVSLGAGLGAGILVLATASEALASPPIASRAALRGRALSQQDEPPPDPTNDPTSAPARLPGEAGPAPSTEPTEGPEPEPTPAADPVADDDEVVKQTDDQRKNAGQFARHAVGVRANMVYIPSYVLSPYIASQGAALCRPGTGNFATDRGVTQNDGCNFYVGAEYIYRVSRAFDISPGIGYQQMKLPDAYFLDKSETIGSPAESAAKFGLPVGGPDLTAADYTEVNMSFVSMEVDFIGRAPIVKRPDFEFDLGGGAGIGMAIIVGPGVFQSGIGPLSPGFASGTCRSLSDFSDFTRCTPAWYDDEDVDEDGDGNLTGDIPPTPNGQYDLVADCTKTKCSEGSLEFLGTRREANTWPVYPVLNLILSARFIIKDAFGINVNAGWSTGFYFGGGMHYYFGKKK